ncbi:MAG: FAD:protein FMN transferase [Candidatus Cloacimonetes bacterium]|jgi:thiamine biosynthesis lipoprotein|nr:FAD:protein FMN transferase [Candidatus Cloacimonadota bacterium]
MKRKDIINIVLFILVFAFAAYRYSTRTYSSQRSAFVMDTLVDIKIETKQKNTNELIDNAFKLMEDYEYKFSFYNNESPIWKFNNSKIDSLYIDEELKEMLNISGELFHKTNSHYDITIGALSEIWDFNKEIIPSNEDIKSAIQVTNFEKLKIRNEYLHKPVGMKINLGSLAKGFIVDEVVKYLKQQNVISGFVNAGGDMRIFGRKKSFKIGIQHPRSESNEMIDVINVRNKAVVTSGDYERYFVKEGIRYHHIIDPLTGYPSQNAISVTVVTETALMADAYSTALFLLEPEHAIKLAEATDGLEAVVYFFKEDKIEKLETVGFKQYYE